MNTNSNPYPTPSLPHKTSPAPNFFHTYTTTLPLPLKRAYALFGTSTGHERVCRLFSGCSGVVLGRKDSVAFPVNGYEEGRELVDVAVRRAEAEPEAKAEGEAPVGPVTGTVTRQHFTMEETIPLLFGLFTSTVRLTGTLSWDDAALSSLSLPSPLPDQTPTPTEPLYALYESIGNAGIQVWKLRIFTPDPSDPLHKTQITERIEGWAPLWLRAVVQRETRRGHMAHMDLYHTLCSAESDSDTQ